MRLLVILAVLGPATASAEVVRVHAQLVGPDAEIAVRVVSHGSGPRTTMAQLELPPLGVVVGGTALGHPLRLVDSEHAGEAFAALQEAAPVGSRGHAILVDLLQRGTVVIEAVLPDGDLVADVTVRTPTCFSGDVRYVAVPGSWGEAIVPATPPPACANGLDNKLWIALPTDERIRDRIGGIAGRLVLADVDFAKVELDLAARIADVPSDLATVILVDASRSLTAAMRDRQRELVAAYLRATPRGRIQVLAYDREVRALLPRWTAARDAGVLLDRELRALVPHNGSNVDLAIRAAARWLAGTSGTHRIIVVGDDLVPARIARDGGAALARELPAGTLVHAVAVGETAAELVRDDAAVLAPLAGATHGIAMMGGGRVDATVLVRPIALEHVVVTAPGWTAIALDDDRDCPTSAPGRLREGDACTVFLHGPAVAGPVRIEGVLWNEPIVRVLRPERARGVEVARELSLLDVDDDMRVRHASELDRAAHAVNPAWSLYARWGGTGGYGDTGGAGFGLTGFGPSGETSGIDGFNVATGPPQPDAIRAQLARAIAACAPDRAVRAEVGMTRDEIVDVTVATTSEPLRACVDAALWKVEPAVPDAPPRQTIVVDVP